MRRTSCRKLRNFRSWESELSLTFVVDFSSARKIKKKKKRGEEEREREGERERHRRTRRRERGRESVNSGTQEVCKDCLLLMIFPNAHPWIHRNAVIRLRS